MVVRSKAPLRLGFAGGGTDISNFSELYGGNVLNATINMYAYCTLEERDDDKVEFVAADRNEKFLYEAVSTIDTSGILSLHKGVYNRIVKDFNKGQPIPVTITTYSDAPAGSGLGSSSTLVVAILKAFVEWLNLPLGEYEVAHLAYEIERIDIGLAGGKQDQYAATFGGFNFMEFYNADHVIVNPLRIKNWIIDELESSLVLFNTGTSRESARIIEEQEQNVASNNIKSIDALKKLKEDAVYMKEMLLKGNIKNFAEVLKNSWEAKKKTAGQVTNENINKIYDLAISAGAYAGKVSGAGGGGFMMFICDPVKKLSVINSLSQYKGTVMNVSFTKEGTKGWKIY